MFALLRLSVVASFLVLSVVGQGVAAEPALDAVRKRGELICGVNGELPGFSFLNAVKQREGSTSISAARSPQR